MSRGNPETRAVFKLSPVQNHVMALLMDHAAITAAEIEAIMRQQHNTPTEAKVAIYRLRKRLAKFGIEIESDNYKGYWFLPSTKDVIRRKLEQTGGLNA